MKRRGPKRSARAPKRLDVRNITIVDGSVASPALSALYPATCWRNSTSVKKVIDKPPYIDSVSRLPTAKFRRRNNPSGSIGSPVRASRQTNTPRNTTPPIRPPATSPDAHPAVGWRISAKTGPARPTAHSTAPGQSTARRVSGRTIGGIAIRTINSVAITNGMLTRKIHRHDAASISDPPTNGPITAAIPDHAVHDPIAPPRSAGGKAATITASALGVKSAPNTPCKPRAPTTNQIDGATAHSSDAAPKPPTPSANTRRSPNTSPSDPPTRISDPSASRYAFEIHCWPARPPPRSRWIAGSATLTTVASSPATNDPMIAATRTRRLLAAVDSPATAISQPTRS